MAALYSISFGLIKLKLITAPHSLIIGNIEKNRKNNNGG